MKTASHFIEICPHWIDLKAVFFILGTLLHGPVQGGLQGKRSNGGEAVRSGWPSARPARNETEKIEKDTSTGWAEGLW